MNNLLNISIVLYKTPVKDINQCLLSLRRFFSISSIYLIDNSPEKLNQSFLKDNDIIYIHNPSNPGYGTAHNIAIRKSMADNVKYHLVINADVFFEQDILSPIISFMDLNEHVGLLMPKIISRDGSMQRLCKLVPTPFDLILRRFFPSLYSVRRKKRYELWDVACDKIAFVPYLSGCFMFLRCDAIKRVGLFDERFFMYPEDIDLSRRIAVAYDTIFFPSVSACHGYEAASYKSSKMLFIHMFNLIKYFNKWGWIFDYKRDLLNEKTLAQLKGS
jgi:GT2 family glycosyltransferase